MKKIILHIIFTFTVFQLSAQITITSENFPQIGDTLVTATDRMPGPVSLTAGANQTWDYSFLEGNSFNTVIQPASEGDSSDLFPDAELLITTGPLGESYYVSDDNTFELLGYIGGAPDPFSLTVLARFEPNFIERQAPLQYQDQNITESSLLLPFSFDSLPSFITDSIPFPAPDSIRLNIVSSKESNIDAWGKINIPMGQFDVLREKVTDYRETKVEVLVTLGPLAFWQDVTQLLAGGFDQLGADTLMNYRYLSNEASEIIADVRIDPTTNEVISVNFKSEETITNVSKISSKTANVSAYPNPAINDVRFDFLNLKPGQYKVNLFNILGTKVMEEKFQGNGDKTINMDLSNLKKGTYLYSLEDQSNRTLFTKRLIVIRP